MPWAARSCSVGLGLRVPSRSRHRAWTAGDRCALLGTVGAKIGAWELLSVAEPDPDGRLGEADAAVGIDGIASGAPAAVAVAVAAAG